MSDSEDADDGVIQIEALSSLLAGWFTKKPPQRLASSKRRWFVLNKEEVRYYSTESELVKDQKGTIELKHSTKARAAGSTLKIQTEDREWVLIADAQGQEGSAQAMLWAQELNRMTKYLPQWEVVEALPPTKIVPIVLKTASKKKAEEI
eukprot:gene18169-22652_t